jgi:hypothetical protein
VLDPVLVAGDQAAADAPVVGVLARVIEQVAVAVQTLDDLRADRGLLAEEVVRIVVELRRRSPG